VIAVLWDLWIFAFFWLLVGAGVGFAIGRHT